MDTLVAWLASRPLHSYGIEVTAGHLAAALGILVGALVVGSLLRQPPPNVILLAFGSSSVDFEVNAWIDDPWESRQKLSDLHDAIWWALNEAGITIAFPQLDLHLDAPMVEAARKGAGLALVGPDDVRPS